MHDKCLFPKVTKPPSNTILIRKIIFLHTNHLCCIEFDAESDAAKYDFK